MNARWSLILFAGTVVAVATAGQQDPPQEYLSIKNFLRVSEQICTGGSLR
jgi:hypothetical protein